MDSCSETSDYVHTAVDRRAAVIGKYYEGATIMQVEESMLVLCNTVSEAEDYCKHISF
jgi:hypothetical protein